MDPQDTQRPGLSDSGPGEPEGSAPGPAREPATDGELAARLRLLIMRLQRRLRVEAEDELTPSQVAALVSVERHGPLTLGRLAEIERVTPPSITRVVAALEAAGLVSREADPGDRRVARVSITAQGSELLQRNRTRKTAFLAERLTELGAADLAAVRDALPVLERMLEEDR
jgi:DNA-binding MarR family transcriptional regulator